MNKRFPRQSSKHSPNQSYSMNLPATVCNGNWLFLLLVLFASSLQAKVLEDTDKADKVSDHFMSQIVQGDVSSAFSLIGVYLGVDAAGFEERGKKAEMSLSQLTKTLGKPLSYALLEKQAVGEHFYKIIYLLTI